MINSVEHIAFSNLSEVIHIRFVSGLSFETRIELRGTTYLLLKMDNGASNTGSRSESNAGIL